MDTLITDFEESLKNDDDAKILKKKFDYDDDVVEKATASLNLKF